jgi:2-pyrone-4,6-dicarboxylate lactonase
MQRQLESFPEWVRDTRAPVPLPPPKSCDCQIHIYGDPRIYPPKPDATYTPPDATFEDARRVIGTLGFERGVIVHPMPYGSNHQLLIDVLEALGPEGRAHFRATAIVDDKVTDRELERLDALGVVGARYNVAKFLGETHSPAAVRRSMERIREIGWHARLHFAGPDLLEHSDLLRSVRDLTMVIDHMGHVDFSQGLDDPAPRWILDMLKNERWWMMVSNGNRISRMEAGWDDAVPFGKAYIEAAPDRIIWGSDWPHVQWRKKRMMNDAEEVELLYRYVDNDQDLLRKIMVDNPARLHGFED